MIKTLIVTIEVDEDEAQGDEIELVLEDLRVAIDCIRLDGVVMISIN